VRSYCDPYWKDYYPPYTGKGLGIEHYSEGYFVVSKAEHVVRSSLTSQLVEKMNGSSVPLAVSNREGDLSGELVCPQCHFTIGLWNHNGLSLIRDHALFPLYALSKTNIHICKIIFILKYVQNHSLKLIFIMYCVVPFPLSNPYTSSFYRLSLYSWRLISCSRYWNSKECFRARFDVPFLGMWRDF
jgi:hypothetical protein